MRKLTKFPLRVELGNELYAVLNDVAFPKASDYIAKSRKIHDALKKIDPSIQIGIVGVGADLEGRILGDAVHRDTDPSVDMETTQKGRVLAWNKALRENADIFDAVTIHISPPINGPLDKFTPDSLMQYLFAFNESSAGKLRTQAESFPGKELWITEWGFLPMAMLEAEGPKRDRAQFLKTPGLAVARGGAASRHGRNPRGDDHRLPRPARRQRLRNCAARSRRRRRADQAAIMPCVQGPRRPLLGTLPTCMRSPL